jgi:hypothetical protein
MTGLTSRPVLVAALVAGVISGCGGRAPGSGPPVRDTPPCGPSAPPAPGNECCSDGSQRPDCALAAFSTGYWELPCPAPLSPTCGGLHTETFNQPGGTLFAVYTTGTFHVMPGQVSVSLDGNSAAEVFDAALPGGNVNPPLNLGVVASGSHTIVLQFTSTDGRWPASWGGFLDLYVK